MKEQWASLGCGLCVRPTADTQAPRPTRCSRQITDAGQTALHPLKGMWGSRDIRASRFVTWSYPLTSRSCSGPLEVGTAILCSVQMKKSMQGTLDAASGGRGCGEGPWGEGCRSQSCVGRELLRCWVVKVVTTAPYAGKAAGAGTAPLNPRKVPVALYLFSDSSSSKMSLVRGKRLTILM